MRYSAEVRKLEDTCLEALGAMARNSIPSTPRGHGHRRHSSSLSSALAAISEEPDSQSPVMSAPVVGSPVSTLANSSFRSSNSSCPGSNRPASAQPVPNSLLKGMPGRELSPSKTDGALFAGDFDEPPILVYPNDLSTAEFDQHPLAKDMDLTPAEKARLGLILPKQIPSRDVWYNFDSDDELECFEAASHAVIAPKRSPKKSHRGLRRFGIARQDASPVPPLPSIPESLRSSLTPKGLVRLFERRKHGNGPVGSGASMPVDNAPSQRSATASGAPLSPGSTKPTLVSNSSNLEVRLSSGSPHGASSSGSSGPLTPATPTSPPRPGSGFESEKGAKGPSSARFAIAPPRLSPMEYARMYLLEAAQARKEGRECELPPPRQLRHWTSNWESFVITPSVPKAINRYYKPGATTKGHVAEAVTDGGSGDHLNDSDDNSATTVKAMATPRAACPRLSLHLGATTPFFPSVMSMARLGRSLNADPLRIAAAACIKRQMRRKRTVPITQTLLLTSIVEEHPQEGDDDGTAAMDLTLRSMSFKTAVHCSPSADTGRPKTPQSEANLETSGGATGSDWEHDQLALDGFTRTMAWLDQADASSMSSPTSANTTVLLASDCAGGDKAGLEQTPSSSPRAAARASRNKGHLPSAGSTLLSTLERPVLEYSPASATSSPQSASRMALSRTMASQARRGEHGDADAMQAHVIADGHLRADAGRARSSEGKAHSDTVTEPDLQPAPLNVQKRQVKTGRVCSAERSSVLMQGLSEEISKELAEFTKSEDTSGMKDKELCERSAQLAPMGRGPARNVRHLSLEDGRGNPFGSARANREQPKLERAASVAVSAKPSGLNGASPRGDTPAGDAKATLTASPTLPVLSSKDDEAQPAESLARRRRREKLQKLLSPSGTIRRRALAADGQPPASKASNPGPSTIEPQAHSGPAPAASKGLAPEGSSFALNQSKGGASITLLPRLDEAVAGSKAGRDSHIPVPVAPRADQQALERQIRRRAGGINAMTPLAFQRFDTAARLASAIPRAGTDASAPRALRESKSMQGPSGLGSLFRKYSRPGAGEGDAVDSGAAGRGRPGQHQPPRFLRKSLSHGHSLEGKARQKKQEARRAGSPGCAAAPAGPAPAVPPVPPLPAAMGGLRGAAVDRRAGGAPGRKL